MKNYEYEFFNNLMSILSQGPILKTSVKMQIGVRDKVITRNCPLTLVNVHQFNLVKYNITLTPDQLGTMSRILMVILFLCCHILFTYRPTCTVNCNDEVESLA